MKLEEYPIIKEYKVFPTGSYHIGLKKGIETEEEENQFYKFQDEVENEKRI